MISALLGGGANYLHGIEFRTSELRKHRDRARALAIKAAREKATALAGELNQSIGEPITISETQNWWSSSYGGHWGSSAGSYSNVAQNVTSSSPSSGGETDDGSPTQPGKIRINAKVSVSFELVAPSPRATAATGAAPQAATATSRRTLPPPPQAAAAKPTMAPPPSRAKSALTRR